MTESTLPADVLDGNAAAGVLRSIFAVELTGATGQCDGCGQRAALAEAHLFTHSPGLVARCVGCDAVLFRLVLGPERAWLDLRGLRVVEIAVLDSRPGDSPAR